MYICQSYLIQHFKKKRKVTSSIGSTTKTTTPNASIFLSKYLRTVPKYKLNEEENVLKQLM